MTEEKTGLTIIQEEDGSISIQGNEEDVKKVSTFIAELFLKDEEMTEEKLDTIVDIAQNLYNDGKGSPEHLAKAKYFLEKIEKYSYPRAMYELAVQEEDSLTAQARMLRAAAVGASPAIDNILEMYTLQADYWRKKIAAKEGNPFEGNTPTIEEILNSDELSFFKIYKQAFNGDLEAMKICLEFCEEEVNYWNKR